MTTRITASWSFSWIIKKGDLWMKGSNKMTAIETVDDVFRITIIICDLS